MTDIQKAYEELRKRHPGLPLFSEVDSLFEISNMEKERFLLRSIRRSILEEIEYLLHSMEPVFQPENSVAGMHECRFLQEDEKQRFFDLYRKLAALHRKGIAAALRYQEDEEAAFIASVCRVWKPLAADVATYLAKIAGVWERESESEEKAGYFG